MSATVRVGLLDSGVGPGLEDRVAAARAFKLGQDGAVAATPAGPDWLGHGTAVAGIVAAGAPAARLLVAQIFAERLVASAAEAAAGLDWLMAEQARLVCMSFGLRDDRRVLREACARAHEAGVVLLAAAPARGRPVYPASYPDVLRVTGDARCRPGELSALGTAQADFGACVLAPDGRTAGASIGAAHAAAVIARMMAAGDAITPDNVAARLSAKAGYRGPERRGHRR